MSMRKYNKTPRQVVNNYGLPLKNSYNQIVITGKTKLRFLPDQTLVAGGHQSIIYFR